MYTTSAFARQSADGPFEKIEIKRGNTGDDDVEFDIKFCGICHTDVHQADNDFGRTTYPIVPGHELAGVVTKVGMNVHDVSVGDHVGVGCMVDSCMQCTFCKQGDEVSCVSGNTPTYNGPTKYGRISTHSGITYGGYSGKISVNRHFIIKIPKGYPLEAAGPIFCAGITMYTPLKNFGALSGGKRVGIVGIGGLGQMGVRLAAAMGNEVTAISTTASKEVIAKQIGAKRFVVSKDKDAMAAAAQGLDLILNTVSANHEAMDYEPLLDRKGVMVQLGAVLKPHTVSQLPLVFRQIILTGSLIGNIKDTQDCIDFCQQHNIVPETEIITWNELNEVYKSLKSGNDRVVRYVLDLDKSLNRN